jgi:hypothetical protein
VTYSEKALQAADDLMDTYPSVVDDDSVELLRHLLAMAWLKGSHAGGVEAIDFVFDQLKQAARV